MGQADISQIGLAVDSATSCTLTVSNTVTIADGTNNLTAADTLGGATTLKVKWATNSAGNPLTLKAGAKLYYICTAGSGHSEGRVVTLGTGFNTTLATTVAAGKTEVFTCIFNGTKFMLEGVQQIN